MKNPQIQSPLPYKHSELTEQILACFYKVYNTLGYGFLEKVYENALYLELTSRGLGVAQQKPISVWYQGHIMGDYYADLVVNDLVLIEVKAVKALLEEHEAQILNYLKATPYEVGLLLNFGPKPEQKRRSFVNSRKEWLLQKSNEITIIKS